jgi:hypothetical protein
MSKSSKDVIRGSWYLSLDLNPGLHEYQIVLTTQQKPQGVELSLHKYQFVQHYALLTK